jgi:hypothetical protein
LNFDEKGPPFDFKISTLSYGKGAPKPDNTHNSDRCDNDGTRCIYIEVTRECLPVWLLRRYALLSIGIVIYLFSQDKLEYGSYPFQDARIVHEQIQSLVVGT